MVAIAGLLAFGGGVGGKATSSSEVGEAEAVATARPAPTWTQQPMATPTPYPTRTQQATAAPRLYPAPILLTLDSGARLSGKATFVWQWNHPPLPADHYFDLRIWSEQEQNISNDQKWGVIKPTSNTRSEVALQGAPAIMEYGVVFPEREQPQPPPQLSLGR